MFIHKQIEHFRAIVVPVIIAAVLSLLSVFQVIMLNYPYQDDVTRIFRAYGWDFAVRPLATLMMKLVGLGSYVSNISPLSQSIAVLLVVLSSALLSCSLLPKGCRAIYRVALIIIISLSPYLLQNYSYQLDSLPDALGLFLAVIAYSILFYEQSSGFLGGSIGKVLVSAVLMLAVLCLYQPMVNIFLIACLAKIYLLLGEAKQRLRFLFKQLFCLLLSMLFAFIVFKLIASYYFDIVTKHHTVDNWGADQAQLTMLKIPFNLLKNGLDSWRVIYHHWFKHINIFGFALMLLIIGWGVVFTREFIQGLMRAISIKDVLFKAVFRLLLFSIIIGFGPLGIVALLDHPELEPRIFVGFGAMVAVIFAFIVQGSVGRKWLQILCLGLSVLLIWSCLLFSSMWSNAFIKQYRFNNRVTFMLVQDVFPLQGSQRLQASFFGNMPWAPLISQRQLNQYPLLVSLVGIDRSAHSFQNFKALRRYGLISKPGTKKTVILQSKPIVKRLYYSIYGKPGDIAIEFNVL